MRRLGRRRLVVMGDQAIASASNVLVAVLVARSLSPTMFGAFSVAMIGYQLSLGAVRATVGEPWLSAHSTDRAWRRSAADLAHAAVAAAVIGGLIIAAAAVVLGGPSSSALLVLAGFLPVLALQDGLRHVAVVERPGLAATSDVLWLVVATAGVGITTSNEPAAYILAWGVGGAVGLVALVVAFDVPWSGGSASRWFRMHRSMASAFLSEFFTARAVANVVVLSLGPLAGYKAVGSVRAAQVFYGPLNTLFAGIYLALVPDGAKQRDSPHRLLRMMVYATGLVVGVAAAWVGVGIVMPDRLGTALFGATWAEAQELMLPMGLGVIAGSAATGAFGGLRSLAAYRQSLRARIYEVPAQVILMLGGAVIGGVLGYAVGFALSSVVMAIIWWVMFLGVLSTVAEEVPATTTDEPPDVDRSPFPITES